MVGPFWRMAVASATGTSHDRSGAPCQDSAAHVILDTDHGTVMVVAVCDGAGSAAHAEIGSAVAAAAFVDLVRDHFETGGRLADIDRDRAGSWLDATRGAVEAVAKEAGRSLRDHACTLVAAIVGEDDAAYIQVGDGAIVVRAGDETGWSYVFWPQHGEFANTTNFIVSPNAADVMDFDYAPHRVDEFAVFSDGIEKLVLHEATRSVHDPFFDAMFPPVRACGAPGPDARLSDRLCSSLGSPRVGARTDDDKTLVLATRRAVAPDPVRTAG